MRTPLATLAVAALLVSAGCSAIPGGGGEATTTSRFDTGVDPIYEPPLNDTAVLDAHTAALTEAGTVTMEQNYTMRTGDDASQSTVGLIRADLDTGAVYAHLRLPGQVLQVYRFGNGTTYEKSVSEGRTTYRNVSGGVRPARLWLGPAVVTALDAFEFEYTGADTVDGETVHVYAADGGDVNASALVRDASASASLESANATLRVRENGVVTRVEYAYRVTVDGTVTERSVVQAYSGLGDTDVSPPVWIPEARNETRRGDRVADATR